MRITCISDTHGQHKSKKLTQKLIDSGADMLLYAGDLQANRFDNGVSFINWLNLLPIKYKVCTFGNHDFSYKETLKYSKKFDNTYFLVNESVEIEGLKIFGSPYSLPFGNWAFMESDDILKEYYSKIPDDTDILITHGAPFSILDKTWTDIRTGSVSLLERVQELKNLKLHVFGHIHESYGIDFTGKYVNASSLNERHKMKNDPVIIDRIYLEKENL